MPKAGYIQRAPTVQQAKVFHQVNPHEIFSNLEEIGHGSFGEVYKATKEGRDVAIKLMKIPGGFSSDEWGDIYKEILFLSEIEHDNIIGYYGAYQHELSVWLVMEFAVGSCQDVMDVFKKPLPENEIGAIVTPCLQALEYLHLRDRIHRDIKAGNILLTEDGTVKLADFGSGSTNVPANSLIGTPYWMAPEMIMAMETGTYGTGVDIWSLGITSIELAERRPPLFKLNAMTALYHIPQKDPPCLSEPSKFSTEFDSFVKACLQKDPTVRPDATTLLQHPFALAPRDPDVVFKLVERTKDPELLQSNASAVEKVLNAMAIVAGGGSADPTADLEDDSDISSTTSTTVTSSIDCETPSKPHSPPISRSGSDKRGSRSPSRRRSLTSIVEDKPEVPIVKETALQEARTNRYLTKQANRKDQIVSTQLKEIQKLRKDQAKVLEAMKHRHETEMTKIQHKAEHHQEHAMKSREKELEKHLARCRVEKEHAEKFRGNEINKFWKTRRDVRAKARAAFSKAQANEVKASKASLKAEKGSMSKAQMKEQMEQLIKGYAVTKEQEAEKLETKIDQEDLVAQLELDLSLLPQLHSMLCRHLQTEVELLLRNNDAILAVKTRRLEDIKTAITSYVDDRTQTVRQGMRQLEEMEMRQAHSVCDDNVRAQKKAHLTELRSQPKALKQTTQRIRRDYDNTIRGTQRKYKELLKKMQMELSKGEQQETLKSTKAEREMTISQLEAEFQEKLADVIDTTTSTTAKRHRDEMAAVEAENADELDRLADYQAARSKHTDAQLETVAENYRQRLETAEKEHAKFVALTETESHKQKARMATIQREQATELMALQQRLSEARSKMM
eukprot:m.96074 g.96074  ORF g.96074 m.96074 type:complete len:846 (-) comp10141_c0_seq1:145-2682(-)